MATCVIECTPALGKRVVAAASLHPTAIMPTEMSAQKPGPSSSSHTLMSASAPVISTLSTIMENDNMVKPLHRGIKRPASTWKKIDEAETIRSMTNRLSNTAIAKPSTPTIPTANDPSDVLLHQLTELCQKTADTLTTVSNSKNNNYSTINIFESDRSSSTLKSTRLANHFISCFVVGGEIRLCAPQIYSIIMSDIHESDLSHHIREFTIVDHMASEEQLVSLKLNRAIPSEAGTCGLITKTNAERLVGTLIDPVNYRTLPDEKKLKFEPLLIQHDCFGGCEGRLFTSLYPGPCVECIECTCLMTTESFCRHSHVIQSESEKVAHWGFDAANWPKYIRLHELAEREDESIQRFYWFIQNYSQQTEEEAEEELEAIKKPMISAPLSVLAAQLLAQQQQQQQQHGQPSTSAAVTSSAPSSFIPTSGGGMTQANHMGNSAPSSAPIAPQPPVNIQQLLSMLQLQNALQSASTTPNEQTMGQLRAALHSQIQQQQHQPPQAPIPPTLNGNPVNALLSAVHHLQQQQQAQSALNNLRNAAAASNQVNDESEIPRKRAHTICDPSMRPIKQEDMPLSTISFGSLPTDQHLVSLLSHVMEADTLRQVTDCINVSIAHRVQPIVDENAKLRKEVAALREDLQGKNDLLNRFAALRHLQPLPSAPLQHPLLPLSLLPSSSLASTLSSLQSQVVNNNESDIEIDDISTR